MKYTVKYSCGHGTHGENLLGREVDRTRRIEWMERNKVCPACYESKKLIDDQTRSMKSNIGVYGITVYATVEGNLIKHKDTLSIHGFRWVKSTITDMLMLLSQSTYQYQSSHTCTSIDDVGRWVDAMRSTLTNLGYEVTVGDLHPSHFSDPKPSLSPLHNRIIEIENKAEKWQRCKKIYGGPGNYSFYVADKKYTADDDAVIAYKQAEKQISEWSGRHPNW